MKRLVTPPDAKTSGTNPSGASRSMMTCWQPWSSGVTDLRRISARASSSVSFFKADLPGEELPVHHPVAPEAPERIGEGGGAVLLEGEVAHPREAVAGDRHQQQQPGVPGREGGEDEPQHQRAAGEVQLSAGGVAMLGEVVRI